MLTDKFNKGLKIIQDQYHVSLDKFDYNISYSTCMSIDKDHDNIAIQIIQDCNFFRLVSHLLSGNTALSIVETPKFDELAYMLDCSRNGVMHTKALRDFVISLALNGYNELYLYTEDTYEVANEPYFGHMRGRYSRAEIAYIESLCDAFFIKLVPCIQTLSHLNAPLKWPNYSSITEYDDTLKVGFDKTYELIENCISSCRSMYSSNKIHIGMDEACLLAAVTQSVKMKLEDKEKLFFSHLQRVNAICQKYNFQPIIWTDMLFKLDAKSYFDVTEPFNNSLIENLPANITLCYWNYYKDDYQSYDSKLKNHVATGRTIMFAGGAWKWVGFAPYNKWSFNTTIPALQACIDNGIKKVMCTAWGDYGDECSNWSVAPVISLYAEMCYNYDNYMSSISHRVNIIFRADYQSLIDLDLINEVYSGMGRTKDILVNNSSKYLLYSDVFNAMFDFNVDSSFEKHYKAIRKKLVEARAKLNEFAYLVDTHIALVDCLAIKCSLSTNIKQYYDDDNISMLENVHTKTIPKLIRKIKIFYQFFKQQWQMEKKSFGFDVQEIRIGGVLFRLESVGNTIRDYCNGSINTIAELEEERLPYMRDEKNQPIKFMLLNQVNKIISPNIL